jgi:ureidoacrylate peracid hydrolase
MSLAPLEPGAAALLVIDMQNAFVHPEGTLGISGVNVAPAQAIVPTVALLIRRFHAAGLPVIWTVQEHLATDRKRDRKRLAAHTAKRKRVSALAGTWDAEIVEELKPLAAAPSHVLTKHRFGAFHQTRLEQLLAMLGTEALFVTGATANACVETTLREAYLRDYDVVAVTDAIAGVRPEWEATAREVWAQYFGVLATAAEVTAWLDDKARPRTRHLHHLLLRCSDLERTKAFLVEVLGFEIRPTVPLADGTPIVGTRQGIGLIGGREGGGQVDHFAFEVTDVRGLAQKVEAAGVPITRPLGPGPYGLTLYVQDPDGNVFELFEDLPEHRRSA